MKTGRRGDKHLTNTERRERECMTERETRRERERERDKKK